MIYADASAVVAFLVNEPHTPALMRWLEDHADLDLVSADWCITEVASALSRKVRVGTLAAADARDAWLEFHEACDSLLDLASVEADDFSAAAQLCLVPESGMRAGDSLHLAVARRLRCDSLLSFDRTLRLNAEISGMKLVEP